VLAKVLLDRLVLTPPFLAFTLVSLRSMDSGRLSDGIKGAKAVYVKTLMTNWKVGQCGARRRGVGGVWGGEMRRAMVCGVRTGVDGGAVGELRLCAPRLPGALW
jgi:hypothetical protein